MLLGLVFSLQLAGCVTNQVKEAPQSTAKPVLVAPAEIRSEFDAAMALMGAEQYREGIAALEKLLVKSQKFPVVYVNIAIAHMKLDEPKEAEENFKRALKIDPDHPVAGNEYGLLLRKTGRFAESRKLYEELLVKYPRYPVAHKNLGILCDLYLRDYQCALREYESYAEAEPDDKNVKIWIADVKSRLGK